MALTALTWLPIVLTLTLFIAVLMTLTRGYRDSEMVVWFTSGQSLFAWVGPVLRFAWPIILAIALLALFVMPWSNAQIEESRERFAKRDDVSRVAPGRFIESGGADRVFFVESVDFVNGQVRNVFVSTRSRGREGLIVAAQGLIEVAPNGDRFLVLGAPPKARLASSSTARSSSTGMRSGSRAVPTVRSASGARRPSARCSC
jgi:lipopolysaccharide export system permease protein